MLVTHYRDVQPPTPLNEAPLASRVISDLLGKQTDQKSAQLFEAPPSSEDDVISASERDTAAFFKIPNVEDPIAASRSISSMEHRSW